MNFDEKISDVSRRSKLAETAANTEEATKTSVILPFIRALGYDVFDLEQVVPEFIADVGVKKGEKVDFVLKADGRVSVLVECKPISMRLNGSQYDQLYRYFSVTEARVAILTNGREFWFFSDIDDRNRMDRRPFLKVDIQNVAEHEMLELEKFQRDKFNVDALVETASSLRYMTATAAYLAQQLEQPDDEFVRHVGKTIYDGTLTKAVVEQLRPSIQGALDTLIRARIEDRLGVAFSSRPERAQPEAKPNIDEVASADGIETTEEEIQAFMIVRAIAAKAISVERVTMRDAKSYCSVLVDDNNRRPVCRLHFNSKTVKYLGLFDDEKNETRIAIDSVQNIYDHMDAIIAAVLRYV